MDECPGSRRELSSDPPADRAATCPECGREVQVEPEETDDGLRFTVAPHARVVGGG
ncbi:hypothetical protein Mycch_2261 [Mycolicibacterium chubuense NBB4]|uniref:Uncharacterized protein n=1 Tax=Mycolicibacterium chubuense (strain NBB4) TaxID=710421 RepID=I4BIC9_MYCCN|nr:hypothetical protein [Mycolicibacterium chubuense]AFM17036.1 hypothetical protein Mycch_2261 [Mycolicibacterium chubuense NBB4]